MEESGKIVRVEVKPWYTSKTLWFNVLYTIASVLVVLADSPLFTDKPEIIAGLLSFQGLINFLLRFITNSPVGK